MVTAGGRVVILDFGLVAELGRAGALSADGGIAGKPAYMAPEQAGGAGDRDAGGLVRGRSHALRGSDRSPAVRRGSMEGDAGQAGPGRAHVDGGPGIPGDLADLTNRLISREPASRPDPLWIARVLAAAAVSAVGPAGRRRSARQPRAATGGPGRCPRRPCALTRTSDGLRPGEVRGGEDEPGRGVPGAASRGPGGHRPQMANIKTVSPSPSRPWTPSSTRLPRTCARFPRRTPPSSCPTTSACWRRCSRYCGGAASWPGLSGFGWTPWTSFRSASGRSRPCGSCSAGLASGPR